MVTCFAARTELGHSFQLSNFLKYFEVVDTNVIGVAGFRHTFSSVVVTQKKDVATNPIRKEHQILIPLTPCKVSFHWFDLGGSK